MHKRKSVIDPYRFQNHENTKRIPKILRNITTTHSKKKFSLFLQRKKRIEKGSGSSDHGLTSTNNIKTGIKPHRPPIESLDLFTFFLGENLRFFWIGPTRRTKMSGLCISLVVGKVHQRLLCGGGQRDRDGYSTT